MLEAKGRVWAKILVPGRSLALWSLERVVWGRVSLQSCFVFS